MIAAIEILKQTIGLRFLLLSLFIFALAACNRDRPFDKATWSERGDLGRYPNRNKMLNDLIKNHKLKGKSYKQLVDLLGSPEQYSNEEPYVLNYNIVTDYGQDIDPVYIKDLLIKLNRDSIVTDVDIKEFKH